MATSHPPMIRNDSQSSSEESGTEEETESSGASIDSESEVENVQDFPTNNETVVNNSSVLSQNKGTEWQEEDTEPEERKKSKRRRSSRSSSKDKISGAQMKTFPGGLEPGRRRNEWIMWREQLTLTLSLKKSLKSQEEKLAFMIVSGGVEIQKALKNKEVLGEKHDTNPVPVFDNALKRLDYYFNTGTNAITDIIRFRNISQKNNEQFIDYVHLLQEQASYCGFGDAEDNEVMMQIRQGAKHAGKLSEMMTRKNKSLADVINYGSSLDTEESLAEVKIRATREEESFTTRSNEGESVAYVHKPFVKRYDSNRNQPYNGYRRGGGRQHNRGTYTPRERNQRDDRIICYNCNKRGHFARDCRSQSNQKQSNNVAFTNEENKNNVRNWFEWYVKN